MKLWIATAIAMLTLATGPAALAQSPTPGAAMDTMPTLVCRPSKHGEVAGPNMMLKGKEQTYVCKSIDFMKIMKLPKTSTTDAANNSAFQHDFGDLRVEFH
jgi:hypothetical protein